jgi:hypothetical protein
MMLLWYCGDPLGVIQLIHLGVSLFATKAISLPSESKLGLVCDIVDTLTY